jgi:hypothetical protein
MPPTTPSLFLGGCDNSSDMERLGQATTYPLGAEKFFQDAIHNLREGSQILI